MTTLPDSDALADLIAEGLFSDDAATRKKTRATLSAHGDAAVAAFFTADKRSYHSIADGAKLFKALKDFDALGINGARVAVARLAAIAKGPQRDIHASQAQPMLDAALRYPGNEEAAFEALADEPEVYLTKPKKVLPRGLSRLRSLTRLRIDDGTLTSAANLDELARIPQRINVELWLKDVDLSLWKSAAENIAGVEFRGRYSNLTDASPLAAWKNLTFLRLDGTQVTDLSPLRDLALTHLNVNDTHVADLGPLAGMTSLRDLMIRRTKITDFSLLARFTGLERLDLGFTSLRDLSVLRGLTKLRDLYLWGSVVDSLEPLVGLPIDTLDLNHTVRPDLSVLARIPTLRVLNLVGGPADPPGLEALKAARPDLHLGR